MVVVLVIVLAVSVFFLYLSRDVEYTDSDFLRDMNEEREHKEAGHVRERSAIDLKMGRFGGHWVDKEGNDL